MGFPRQECWSVLPFPSPGYLPHIGTEPGSPIFIDHAKAFDYMDHNKLWKILKKMGKSDWFQIGKGVLQGSILSPCLFNLYAEYIMQNARLDEAQAEIKIARRNINNLRYADDTTLMAESKKTKEPLDESERGG